MQIISHSKLQRVISMATYPGRESGTLVVLYSLLPQCDLFHLYLNGFNEIPSIFPKDKKLHITLAGPDTNNPDLGSQGKFINCNTEGYFFSVDDDIIYPSDYTVKLINYLDKYNKRVILSAEGTILRLTNDYEVVPTYNYKSGRRIIKFEQEHKAFTHVHLISTSVMICCPKIINLSWLIFQNINEGNDADLAIFAQQNRIPLIRIPTKRQWLLSNTKIASLNPLSKRQIYINGMTRKIKNWKPWLQYPYVDL